jgi:hypothetical protein
MKLAVRVLLVLAGLPVLVAGTPEAKPAAAPATKSADDRFRISDLLPSSLQKNPRLNLSVVTDMTTAGKAIVPPTRDKPAYYVVMDGGLVEEGDVWAGERPPQSAKLAEVMQSSLARSGYQLAAEKNAPTLLIHYRWGVYNGLSGFGDDELVLRNLRTRALLVGGEKFTADLMWAVANRKLGGLQTLRIDERNDMLVSLASSNLYFLLAVAYDYAAAQRGEKKQLWSTRICTDSHGLAMDEALPALVTNAGNYFGHETKGAVLFQPRLFEGKVEVGEPTVVRDPPAAKKP